MKFFSRIKDFFLALKNTKEIQNHETLEEEIFEEFSEPDEPVQRKQKQNHNQTKTNLTKVYGIKKKLVVFLVSGFAVIFFASFLFSGMNKSTTEKPQIPTTNEMPNTPNNRNSFPTYSDMMPSNNQDPNKQNPISNSPENQSDTQPEQNLNQEYSIPPVNYNIPAAPSTGFYAPPFIDPAESKNQSDDYRKSPISFNIGTNSAANNNTINPTESTQEEQTQTNEQAIVQNNPANAKTSKISYSQPEAYTLQQGAIIPVSLLTGIDSDLPGQIICQVRQNVYDSVSGNYLLIPQGTKILGEVKSGVPKVGQERIGVTWQRLIFPNGISIDLGGMEGVDTAGYPGLKDKVDNHTGKIIGATLISSLLAAGAQIAAGNTGDTSNMSTGQLAVSGAATNVMNAGAKMVERNINIGPTIKIRPGIQFNVFVSRDVILKPYR